MSYGPITSCSSADPFDLLDLAVDLLGLAGVGHDQDVCLDGHVGSPSLRNAAVDAGGRNGDIIASRRG